ncbi:MAG: PTS sugar transporter subunit IIB [Erysipelotrichaceae bacterium]|nr:PTS sugar transporter subunit IIB [Erysipelotrichaceae bacterium]
MIKAVRIDHRLVHGQVAFSWTQFLGVNRIIVIDDKAANDEFQKMALNMSKPAGCRLNIFTVEKALSKMPKVETLKDTIFIVFGCTKDASRFIAGYPKIKEMNYGGIAKKEGSKQFGQVVYLNEEEIVDTKKIMDAGVKIYMQQLPTSKREELKLD